MVVVRGKRGLFAVVGAGAFVVGLFVVFAFVSAARATELGRLTNEYPPLLDRSARKPKRGCGLSEARSGGGCAHVDVKSVTEREVVFPSSVPERGLAELRATLSVPVLAVPSRRPAVILLHGSGPTTRDSPISGDLVSKHPTFKVLAALADVLAREGLVVLRWDKRHCVKCYPNATHDPKEVSWLDLDTDARDALRFLATLPEVDPSALVVAGHSEGGQIAVHVGADAPNVVAVMMLAGLYEPFDRGLVNQYRRLADLRVRQWDYLGASTLRSDADGFDRCFAKIAKEPTSKSSMCLNIPFHAWSEVIDYGKRTGDSLRASKHPLFVLQGSVDRNIDPKTVPEVGRIVKEAGGDVELHYVDGVSHSLVNVLDASPRAGLDPSVKDRIVAFVASVGIER